MSKLHDLLPPGTTVHTILRHVSKSGMSRDISLVILTPDGPRDITALAADAMGRKLSGYCDFPAIRVGGTGMDMGYHLVYSLARALYPDGHLCTGTRYDDKSRPGCPSNDHSNDYGRLARQWDEAHGEIDPAATREEREARCSERQQWISSRRTYRRNRRHSDGGYALRQRWM